VLYEVNLTSTSFVCVFTTFNCGHSITSQNEWTTVYLAQY